MPTCAAAAGTVRFFVGRDAKVTDEKSRCLNLLKTKQHQLNFSGTKEKPIARKSFVVRANYNGNSRGCGSDFLAGFLAGGAIVGTLGYLFAPQIRKAILDADGEGFRNTQQPVYYDEGLENVRQTLNDKITRLNSAIDNVSLRLRSRSNELESAVESEPEIEATA